MNPMIRKMENYVRLSAEDRAAAEALWATRPTTVRARDDLIREGDPARAIFIVVSGWACRYRFLEDGRRQIVGLLLPGDCCDLSAVVLREMDHFIGALTPATLAQVPHEAFEAVALAHPRLARAFWWEAQVNMAIQREWCVNLGQRSAFERIAHLMCELLARLRAAGLSDGTSCDFPLTQTTVADITGLSTVHVSRTLQAIREERLVEIHDRRLVVRDLAALRAAAQFTPGYLHLGREGRHLDAPQEAEATA